MILRISTKTHNKCLEAKNNYYLEIYKKEEESKNIKKNKENKQKVTCLIKNNLVLCYWSKINLLKRIIQKTFHQINKYLNKIISNTLIN